ncbi:hypothetical protein SLH46_09910 [Draconibacterium sp. IB214405]|uniref:hypothetical protein n=1 Tax=Draconibacterium sp. IB214405 TaxID=3097352 RepID=UPI002A14BBB1|nr:hypothetical protein [Draconibacterium sp. IB214405]MDX8339497.1 hypothetical protein [Draconibacterium sp. IB214405]
MQRKLFYLFIFLFCFAQVNAQDDLVEHLLELMQVGIVDCDLSLTNNSSVIGQVGNENSIDVKQEQNGLLNNSIFSIQLQTENQAGIVQQGSGHSTILKQDGNQNYANIWSVGSKTVTEVYQLGNGNSINSYIDNQGILPKSNLLTQVGDNNTMEVALLGNGDTWTERLPKTVDATQIGVNNNLELILDNSFLPGIKVTQTGGMTLSIRQSDFYFPIQ